MSYSVIPCCNNITNVFLFFSKSATFIEMYINRTEICNIMDYVQSPVCPSGAICCHSSLGPTSINLKKELNSIEQISLNEKCVCVKKFFLLRSCFSKNVYSWQWHFELQFVNSSCYCRLQYSITLFCKIIYLKNEIFSFFCRFIST